MQKPNIFWILTDGTRAKPGRDKSGRFKTYFDFDKESIRFKKAITTATSTLMSISAILTGRFAAELYPDFNHINKRGIIYPTYFDTLIKEGYNINSVVAQEEAGRELFKDTLHIFNPTQPQPQNAKETYEEFLQMMKSKFDKSKPNLMFVHFGNFEDNNRYSKKLLDYLKEQKLFDESIVILCSDHGYVDYGKFHYLGWALQPRTHSFYVDENSYHANFNIRLPSSISKVRKKEVDIPIALIDMFETIFDYLGFKYENPHKKAQSLKPLIEGNDKKVLDKFMNRIIRTDNRYLLQNYRKIRLLNEFESHVVSGVEELNKLPKNFRDFFRKSEEEVKNNAFKQIEDNFEKSELSKMKGKKIAIYNYDYKDLIEFMYNKLKKHNKVSVLDLNLIKKNYKKYDIILAIINNPMFYKYGGLVSFCKRKGIKLMLVNTFFAETPYKKYHYFKACLNDPAMKVSKYPFIINCGLYVMLLIIKFYETLLLDTERNYHPIIKNL
ncbi:sulfatase-like hydrolase/transferase [Candidatus Woesearchaeota archaeon]|nr:sulfatase-like hydrolase/transferase [Candidatus Woesearchaeota archaeon]